jgi:spore cortex biosynthesis protein YabQ
VEITLQEQMHHFFLSCGMGFLLGLYYELFRIPRLILSSGRRSVFIQDVLFCLSAAVLTFLFSLAVMDGRLRFYLFLGEAIGFAAYYFTIGRLVVRFAKTVIDVIIKVWKMLWKIILAPFRFLFKLISKPLHKFINVLKEFFNKLLVNFKKSLKDTRSVLYNQLKVSDSTTGTRPRALHKKGNRKK